MLLSYIIMAFSPTFLYRITTRSLFLELQTLSVYIAPELSYQMS